MRPPPSRTASGQGAMSLVELLVAVAVVIVLIAVGFPALKSALAVSRKAACAHHLSQLGLGIIAYAQDNNRTLPGPQGTQIRMNTNLPRMLKSYLPIPDNTLGPWECPANLGLKQANRTNNPKIASYLSNEQLFGYYSGSITVRPQTMQQVLNLAPAERWLLRDIDSWNYSAGAAYGGDYPPVHNLGRNVLYLDGSVAWVRSVKGQRP